MGKTTFDFSDPLASLSTGAKTLSYTEARELAEELFEYLRRKGFSARASLGYWSTPLTKIPDPQKTVLIEDLIKILQGEKNLRG